MTPGPDVRPYGPAIHQAIAGGELAHMKATLKHAEEFLAEVGDIPAALELLKAEIVKLEHKKH
jgi:hypothetical protein